MPIQQIVEKMIGTKEQALAEFHISERKYESILEKMEVARNLLTKEEFNQLIKLQTEGYILDKKTIVLGNNEKLEPEDELKTVEIGKSLGPLWEKIYSHFRYTVKDAQKIVDFPIKKPTYTAKGYELKKERVDTDITLGKPKPIINSKYSKGEFSYTIYQSAIMEKEKDPFYIWVHDEDKVENYELEGAKFTFAKTKGSNVKAMKMIVPEKGKYNSYQIVIMDELLNKDELEKIMISFLK